jgi:hypothetical protein
LTKLKNDKFEDVTTPSAFFYTFKSQKALNALLRSPKIKLFPKRTTYVSQADHPSNIIWENLPSSFIQRFVCQFVIFIVFVVYVINFTPVLQVFLSSNTVYTYYHDPPGIDCEKYVKYGGDSLIQTAYMEYYWLESLDGNNQDEAKEDGTTHHPYD